MYYNDQEDSCYLDCVYIAQAAVSWTSAAAPEP